MSAPVKAGSGGGEAKVATTGEILHVDGGVHALGALQGPRA